MPIKIEFHHHHTRLYHPHCTRFAEQFVQIDCLLVIVVLEYIVRDKSAQDREDLRDNFVLVLWTFGSAIVFVIVIREDILVVLNSNSKCDQRQHDPIFADNPVVEHLNRQHQKQRDVHDV